MKSKEHKAKTVREWNHRTGRTKPMSEAKECASFLGYYIAEEILGHYFKNVQRMPYGHKSYDFVCSKGFKVDVKSACLTKSLKGEYPRWFFNIERNVVPDYFLLLAFDNREDLNPLHLWLIPGDEINELKSLSISPNKLSRFKQKEKPLNKIISICQNMKEGSYGQN